MPAAIDMFIVDDNPDDLELTIRTLQRHHLAQDIKVAYDGAEALALLLGESKVEPIERVPKVILLDLKLPKISGLEVVRRLKSELRTRTIPVILYSSSDEEQDVSEAYALGVNSYVTKPVDFA